MLFRNRTSFFNSHGHPRATRDRADCPTDLYDFQHCLGHAKESFRSPCGQQKESLSALQTILHLTTIPKFLFWVHSQYFFFSMKTVKWKQKSTKNTGLGIERISDATRSKVARLYIFVPHRCHVCERAVWSAMNPDPHTADTRMEGTVTCKIVLPM